MKVRALLFQRYMPLQPGLKMPIFTVYVPVGRFVGTVHEALKLRVVFALNARLSQ